MNSTFFASFSETTFNDLYKLNIRSYHQYIYFFEILHDEIIRNDIKVCDDLKNYHRKCPDSYLLCYATDCEDNVYSEKINNHHERLVLLDTSAKDKNECFRKTKDYLYVYYENYTISALCKPNAKVYYDEFYSISWVNWEPMNSCSVSETKVFDLRNVKHKP